MRRPEKSLTTQHALAAPSVIALDCSSKHSAWLAVARGALCSKQAFSCLNASQPITEHEITICPGPQIWAPFLGRSWCLALWVSRCQSPRLFGASVCSAGRRILTTFEVQMYISRLITGIQVESTQRHIASVCIFSQKHAKSIPNI